MIVGDAAFKHTEAVPLITAVGIELIVIVVFATTAAHPPEAAMVFVTV